MRTLSALTLALALAALPACSDDGPPAIVDASLKDGPGKLDRGPLKKDGVTPKPDQSTPKPDQSTPKPDQSTPKPDQSTPKPDQSTPSPDQSTPKPDQSTPKPDQGVPAGSDYVMNSISLPLDAASSTKFGWSTGGKVYNRLGTVLALLVKQLNVKNLDQSVQHALCSGATINLMRVASATTSTAAKGFHWVGQPKSCCSGASCITTTDPPRCNAASTKACFGGATAFTPALKPAGTTSGTLAGGTLSLQGGPLTVTLAMAGTGALRVPLRGVQIRGLVGLGGITGGVLAGGVSTKDLGAVVVPGVAKLIDSIYKSPKTNWKVRKTIKTFFDLNKDGTVDAAELTSNAVLKPLLAGDVDVDGDTVKEVSMGIGFTAVGCKIN